MRSFPCVKGESILCSAGDKVVELMLDQRENGEECQLKTPQESDQGKILKKKLGSVLLRLMIFVATPRLKMKMKTPYQY